MRSTAANSGSGFSTMPGPPPNGMSSTTRCRSAVKSLRSCTLTSSTPLAWARATIPSARGARTIAGKMVTMSIFTSEVQQSLRRVHHDYLRPRIDPDANPADHRNHHFSARPGNHQPALLQRPVDGGHAADRLSLRVLHLAADEVVPVVRPRRQRRHIRLRPFPFPPHAPLRAPQPVPPRPPDDAPPLL